MVELNLMYLHHILYSGGNADDAEDNDDDGGEAIVAAAEPREETRAPAEAGAAAEEEERGANRPENSVGECEIREEPESWVFSARVFSHRDGGQRDLKKIGSTPKLSNHPFISYTSAYVPPPSPHQEVNSRRQSCSPGLSRLRAC